MDKISISDFCGEEKTYAQLIQDLYFHISVKELYMVLASNAAQNRDVYESVSYRNTYSSLENRIPDVCRMTVGELLRYATEKCLSGRNMEELYDEDSIKLGYWIFFIVYCLPPIVILLPSFLPIRDLDDFGH